VDVLVANSKNNGHQAKDLALRLKQKGLDIATVEELLEKTSTKMLLFIKPGPRKEMVWSLFINLNPNNPTGPVDLNLILAKLQAKNHIHVGDILIDDDLKTVYVKTKEIDLTKKEYDILLYFASNPNQVISKTAVLEYVFGYSGYDPNLVEAHISSIRKKIGKDSKNYIITKRGFGYIFKTTV